MVRDSVSGKVILFGGQGNGYLDDIWAFDPVANTWTELNPSGKRPSARVWSSMVYDPHSPRMILFGGERLRCDPELRGRRAQLPIPRWGSFRALVYPVPR
jgi:hypothetical protein